MRSDYKKAFFDIISNRFAIKRSLKIPPHPKHVAALPCEILLSASGSEKKFENQLVFDELQKFGGLLFYRHLLQFTYFINRLNDS